MKVQVIAKNGKIYDETVIIHELETNQIFLERALIVLYDRQTADEKLLSTTNRFNHRGFSAAHARKLSYYARWVLSKRNLSGVHLENAKTILKKYRRQLLDAIVEKANE